MHVVAEIGNNEVVTSRGPLHQVFRQFLKWTDVGNAVCGHYVKVIRYIVKVNEWIVLNRIGITVSQGTSQTIDVFRVCLPAHTGIV